MDSGSQTGSLADPGSHPGRQHHTSWFQATLIKAMRWRQCGDGIKQRDQRTRTEVPAKAKRMRPTDTLRGTREYSMGKSLSNLCCWGNRIFTCKRMKLDNYLIPLTKIRSKWVKDLSVRPETMKFLEENMRKRSWCGSWQWFFRYNT